METIVTFGAGMMFLAVVISAVRKARRKQREEKRLFREFGFEEITQPPEDLLNMISGLRPRLNRKFRIANIYCLSRSDATLRIFDIFNSGNNSSSQKAITVTSDTVSLPRFSVYPRVNFGGFLGRFVNKLVVKIAGKDMIEIKPNRQERFLQKYLLLGKDEEAVSALFSGNLAMRILEKERLYHIEALGNMFMFSAFDPKTNRTYWRIERERLRHIIDDARMFVRIFQETVPSETVPSQKSGYR